MAQPVLLISSGAARDTARQCQLANIEAAKTMAEIVQSTLGPKSMLKMLIDPMGGIVITNDGHAILREIDVAHPAAKSLIEVARAQDEEVGDGTTSAVVLTGELMALSEALLIDGIHPTRIVRGFMRALEDAVAFLKRTAIRLNIKNSTEIKDVVSTAIGSKFGSRWGTLLPDLAVQAVRVVAGNEDTERPEVDIKRYAKVEKIAGGDPEESCVLRGIVLNKDVTHPRMARVVKNPRIVIVDSPLEYKKGESQTKVEITSEEGWEQLLLEEEAEVRAMCEAIISSGCNVLVTEKGVSDLAQHFLVKAGISVIRRARKTDTNRLARACGAVVVNRTEEICERDVGTRCGLFKIEKIGDEYYSYFVECTDPRACSIVLRGGSKDVLNEIERNLGDALCVARNLFMEKGVLAGGGAAEMATAAFLSQQASLLPDGAEQRAYQVVAEAMEVVPRSIAKNCGFNVVQTMATLRGLHVKPNHQTYGIDGDAAPEGQIVIDAMTRRIVDPLAVKLQMLKTGVETAATILRIDEVVSGAKKSEAGGAPGLRSTPEEDGETFGDARDG